MSEKYDGSLRSRLDGLAGLAAHTNRSVETKLRNDFDARQKFALDALHGLEMAVMEGKSPVCLAESLRLVRKAIDERLEEIAPIVTEDGSCVRVGALREFLATLPAHGEVWIGDGNNRSNECVAVHRLNERVLDGTCDVLLDIRGDD